MMRTMLVTVMSVWLAAAGVAQALEWYRYTDPDFGFSIDLPATGFAIEDEGDRLTLRSDDEAVQIDVFSADYEQQMSFSQFAEVVATADPRRVITYRAGGRTWFVVSGYLDSAGGRGDTIFYAKFMASPAGGSLSAFEVSYPSTMRKAMDGFVTRMEKSLTSPSSQASGPGRSQLTN